jgi:hypothetical protein
LTLPTPLFGSVTVCRDGMVVAIKLVEMIDFFHGNLGLEEKRGMLKW